MDLEQYQVNGSQFNMNCTNFTEEEFKLINRFRSITAIICAVIIGAMLLFLICYKAYSSLFQRLFLYLIIGTLLTEIVTALTIEHQWRYKGQETVCMWLGFFALWTYYLVFIFSYEIVGYLLYLVISKIRGTRPTQWTETWRCFCMMIVEITYVLLPVFISTAFAFQAYIMKSYGIAGPWCFVKSLNGDCQPVGFLIQMVFLGMNVAVGIVGIAASVTFIIVYFKLASSYREARHLLKKTLYVMVFQCIHILICMCSLGVRLYTLLSRRHQLYGLWLTHAFTIPTGTLIFPLGFLLGFYPVRKIMQSAYERIKCCKKKKNVNVLNITIHATAPKSNYITQPSSTFFNVPHPESDVLSENTPLNNDAGYGGTHFCC